MLLSQKVTTKSFTRFKVTIFLYPKPNNSARSLSTLIPVSVNKDTPQKVTPVALLTTAE